MSAYGDLIDVLMTAEANREGWEQDRHEAAAEAILASDWLAQRDQRMRDEGWFAHEARMALEAP